MYFSYSGVLDYVDIAGLSSARGRQTMVGWGKPASFELNASITETEFCL